MLITFKEIIDALVLKLINEKKKHKGERVFHFYLEFMKRPL